MANEKTIIDDYDVLDQHGEAQPSHTVTWYPWKTVVNGTNGSDIGNGKYHAVISSADTGKIAHYYDIYIDGVIKEAKKYIAPWRWVIDLIVTTNPQAVTFSGQTDAIQGGDLPVSIANASLQILYPNLGRAFFITSPTASGFTITPSEFRDDNADLPITVRILITVEEGS